jgi:hypothetical protein
MKMTDRRWSLVGGSYCVLAVVTFMAAVSPSPACRTSETKDVAQVSQIFAPDNQRLSDDQWDTRNTYWITIWCTRNCVPCEKQKALVPELEAAGYHVIVRKSPGGRFIKSFPALVITKDKPGGNILHTLYGYHTLTQLDEILGIEEEEIEDPDYDIFSPKATISKPVLIAVLNKGSEKQSKELEKLRGTMDVFVTVTTRRDGLSSITLLYGQGKVQIWRGFVTAEEILDALK